MSIKTVIDQMAYSALIVGYKPTQHHPMDMMQNQKENHVIPGYKVHNPSQPLLGGYQCTW